MYYYDDGKQYILDSSGKPTNREIFNGPKDSMIELKIPQEQNLLLLIKDRILGRVLKLKISNVFNNYESIY